MKTLINILANYQDNQSYLSIVKANQEKYQNRKKDEQYRASKIRRIPK